MKRTSISPGVYEGPKGVFWSRPLIRGRRTWRKLKAVKPAAAVKEHTGKDYELGGTFADLATLYTAAGCPNKRLEERPPDFLPEEEARVEFLKRFFGNLPAASLRIGDLPRYRDWRKKQIKSRSDNRPGDRTVDKDVQTLSNILNYGVATSALEFNFIRAGRPRFQRDAAIRHSREVAPTDATVIHRISDLLLGEVRSEVFGWMTLFAAFTGCRTSELRRLRIDAEGPDHAGFYQPGAGAGENLGHLFLARSKGGVNPWALVGVEFAQMIECFQRWHRKRFPKNPWFFPSQKFTKAPVSEWGFGQALDRAARALNLPHVTPHGFRSFYVTKRRSDGQPDTVIAGEIGDKSVALMGTTYGSRPANWTGGAALSWLPAKGLPAWSLWESLEAKIIPLRPHRRR